MNFGLILLALGLVFLVEGLVYALAPSLVEQVLEALRQMPPEARRVMGLLAMVAGLALIWVAHVSGTTIG
ncbi:MAG: DUF2065 domain-containing protein [Rhodobacterales bacterium]|nr:MAG: DUF2065 domain-containing protein [Rhodobacterales bacterium]